MQLQHIQRLLFIALLGTLSAGLSLLLPGQAQAQPFGNEWINHQQSYYKIRVAEQGIYRISYEQLQAAGMPVATIDPRRLALYHHGQEMAIHVEGQLNGQFEPGEYVEFYGWRNTGDLDQQLYVSPEAQPHQHYSLFTDSSAYFLTWNLAAQSGKRMPTYKENNTGGLPAEAFCWQTDRQVFTGSFSWGRLYPEGDLFAGTYRSAYDYGEGWTGADQALGNPRQIAFSNVATPQTGWPNPTLDVVLNGRGNTPHNVSITVAPNTTTSPTKITDAVWNYYNYQALELPVLPEHIGATGDLIVTITPNGFEDLTVDRIAVATVGLRHARGFDFGGEAAQFTTQANGGGKLYIEASNVPTNPSLWDITDPYNVRRIAFNSVAATNGLNAVVDQAATAREFWLTTDNPQVVPYLQKTAFRNYEGSMANYLMVTHPYLRGSTAEYTDPVEAYATYRASAAGGSQDTLVANVLELYDQFSYGQPTPLAIRRFAAYMIANGQPEFLYLIGKGFYFMADFWRLENPSPPFWNYIPSYGYPGGDIAYTAGLPGSITGVDPALYTGRLTAKTPEEVANYLNKLKTFEARQQEDPLWYKRLVHLSGGVSVTEHTRFRGIVDGFKGIAQDLYLGAQVSTITKSSNKSTELINIAEQVNNGVGLITFFGHSSGQFSDIEIGYVSDEVLGYDNAPYYPFILVNGCSAGEIFGRFPEAPGEVSFGEDWMVGSANKGAIAFMANSTTAFVSRLNSYSSRFYNRAFADTAFLDQPIGLIIKQVITDYLGQPPYEERNEAQVQQMILQGDPALVFFPTPQPDFEVAPGGIYLEEIQNQPITALADSFAINIVVSNLGPGSPDSLQVLINRTIENSRTITYDTAYFSSVLYQDTLRLVIKSKDATTFGNNRFEVFLDPANRIAESNEANNFGELEVFIPLSATTNLFPQNYALMSSTSTTLVAQAIDLREGPRDIVFELDTVPTYNSGFLRRQTVSQAQTLAEWPVTLTNDSYKTYYWRSRYLSPREGEDSTWAESSFTYNSVGAVGWRQQHWGQLDDNNTEGLATDYPSNNWAFLAPTTTLAISTYGGSHPSQTHEDVAVQIGGQSYNINTRACANNSIGLIAFNRSSAIPYRGLTAAAFDTEDPRSCGIIPQVINNFFQPDLEIGTNNFVRKYVNAIEEGDYVVIFSLGNLQYSRWSTVSFDMLEEVGLDPALLEALPDGAPFVLLGRKGGELGTATLITPATNPTTGEAVLNTVLQGRFDRGTMYSPVIGPSTNWLTFQAALQNQDANEDEALEFSFYSIDNLGRERFRFSTTQPVVSLSSVRASREPYLRVEAHWKDSTELSPIPMMAWEVQYNSPPEGILLPADPLRSEAIPLSVQEGETLDRSLRFRNISNLPFTDSLSTTYSLTVPDGGQVYQDSLKLPPLGPGEEASFGIHLNSLGQAGANTLRVQVNTNQVPEENLSNNTLELGNYLEVIPDETHPIIEVLVDGRYIAQKEIVSPSPTIVVKVHDENTLLRMVDTTGINLYFKADADGDIFRRVALNGPEASFTPATESEPLSITFTPQELGSGTYTLRAQAADASGNLAGGRPMEVQFEVITEATITHVYPYPNPFSTSMEFVFTLTGSEVPTEMKIQIMTVTGRVVRELNQDELGPFHIGTNRSQPWNGTDEYGDPLANGVYLYRVVYGSGPALEHRETATGSRGFTNGIGRLYILR